MSIKDVVGILIIVSIPLGMMLGIALGVLAITGGCFGVSKYLKNRKNNHKSITLLITLISLAVIFFGIYLIYFVITFRSRWNTSVDHNYNIDSFVGCFHPSKSTWDSYETMTEDEIKESLKKLDLSKKEFEKRKNECIKQSQIGSFAGCKKEKHKWKAWNEMDEQEFRDTLKYFDIDETFFKYMREGCTNGHWE